MSAQVIIDWLMNRPISGKLSILMLMVCMVTLISGSVAAKIFEALFRYWHGIDGYLYAIQYSTWYHVLRLSMAFTVAIACVWFSSQRAARLITKPLSVLVEHTNDFASTGNYGVRLKAYYQDEIGQLVDSFNRMMDQIQRNTISIRQEKETVMELNHQLVTAHADADAARHMAERSNILKTAFLSNMSHELRTPMNSILGFSRRCLRKLDVLTKEQLQENLKLIHESGERLLLLLNDLLDISKLESGKMLFTMRPEDLQQSLAQAMRELQSQAHDKRITITHVPVQVSTLVQCDNQRMTQVIINLLSNAIRFTPHGRSITLSYHTYHLAKNPPIMQKALMFRIEDEGPGIPPGELELIFDKFRQSSKTRLGGGGTGLGLAICREIIRAHHGTIRAEHHPEGGAIFWFAIPYIQTHSTVETEIL